MATPSRRGWTPLAGATAYKVVLTSGGVVLASVTQTSPPWDATLSLTANSQIQVSVTPLEGKRPGNSARPSTCCPTSHLRRGTFTVTRSGMDMTITQTSLQDDVTPSAEIKRTVVWGRRRRTDLADGRRAHATTTPLLGRYVPTVRLTDRAGNSVTLTLKAAVFGDTTAPTVNVAAGPSSAFARVDPGASQPREPDRRLHAQRADRAHRVMGRRQHGGLDGGIDPHRTSTALPGRSRRAW